MKKSLNFKFKVYFDYLKGQIEEIYFCWDVTNRFSVEGFKPISPLEPNIQLFFMRSVFWLCNLKSATYSTVTDCCSLIEFISFILASSCSFMTSHLLLNVVLSSMQNYECCMQYFSSQKIWQVKKLTRE